MTKEGITLEQIAAQNEVLKDLLSIIEGNLTEGRKARRAADNAAASIRIVEKKNLVLKNENTRLFRKIEDLGNLINEQAARIEELEEGQQQPQQDIIGEINIVRKLEADLKQADLNYKEVIKVNSRLEADVKEGCKIIREISKERDALKEENRIIKVWLEKLGFTYISVHPVEE